MPGLIINKKPNAPGAPSDMDTGESYARLEEFIKTNPGIKEFKIEDDNHGMGMISTMHPDLPKQAINVRLSKDNIESFMINNDGFHPTQNDSVLSRR